MTRGKETCSVPSIDSEEKKNCTSLGNLTTTKWLLGSGRKGLDKVKRKNSKMTTFFKPIASFPLKDYLTCTKVRAA